MEELRELLAQHHLTLSRRWGCTCGEEYGRNYRNPEVRSQMVDRHDHHLARILYAAGATLPAADPREALRARMDRRKAGDPNGVTRSGGPLSTPPRIIEPEEADGWADVDAAKQDPDSPLHLRTKCADCGRPTGSCGHDESDCDCCWCGRADRGA